MDGWLVSWLVSWLVGWLVGWLAGWLEDREYCVIVVPQAYSANLAEYLGA
jgi:hypothetical protein